MKVELSERQTGLDYPRRKQERGETQEGRNIQKTRAMTSSYLTFPAAPLVEITVSPDILAPVPRTRRPNQISIIRLLCPGGRRKTTWNSSRSSFHSMTAISKEKLTLFKGLRQYYPYILIRMSHF